MGASERKHPYVSLETGMIPWCLKGNVRIELLSNDQRTAFIQELVKSLEERFHITEASVDTIKAYNGKFFVSPFSPYKATDKVKLSIITGNDSNISYEFSTKRLTILSTFMIILFSLTFRRLFESDYLFVKFLPLIPGVFMYLINYFSITAGFKQLCNRIRERI